MQLIWKMMAFCKNLFNSYHAINFCWKIYLQSDIGQKKLTNLWFSSDYILAMESFVFNHCISQKMSKPFCSSYSTWFLFPIINQWFTHCARLWNIIKKLTVGNINALVLTKTKTVNYIDTKCQPVVQKPKGNSSIVAYI